MAVLRADVVGAAERLGFPEWERSRLQQVEDELRLPDNAEELLAYCGVQAADREEMLAARPDPDSDPDWWTITSALSAEVTRDLGQALPPSGFTSWPAVPPDASAVGLFAGAWALLANLPRLLELHAQRGVPESITVVTVAALGQQLATHRRTFGRAGTGLSTMWTAPLRFRGAEYEIGRHGYTRTQLGLGDGVSGHVLSMHIPPSGALDVHASEQSVAAAVESFGHWFPEEPLSGFVCHSWLLDPQLAEYLRPDSNIIRFQQRFDLLPQLPVADPSDGDRDLLRLGLQLPVPADALTEEGLGRIPQDTTLQRAFVAHLRAGRHWYHRTGMLKKWR
ncbi:acyltransferase domain-containing protein [Kribbella solani]|uniref:acyltransferase domain-containing protein n=1 Tax=Kribbella solani TaxID=236067 RepID=UPI0029A4A5B1|nr:acyltransferase domain-containing protein [Kribbella solani]MDX3001505.1 acyltransferase domain-containing protein [Kribbella solani]